MTIYGEERRVRSSSCLSTYDDDIDIPSAHPRRRRRVLLGDSGGKPDPQVFPPASSSIVLIYVGKVL